MAGDRMSHLRVLWFVTTQVGITDATNRAVLYPSPACKSSEKKGWGFRLFCG